MLLLIQTILTYDGFKLATIFLIAASATSTAMYTILEAVIQEELEKYSVIGEVGKKMQLVTWLATAFSILATFFWLFSVCCCTGRSPYGKKKKTNTFKKVEIPHRGHTEHSSTNLCKASFLSLSSLTSLPHRAVFRSLAWSWSDLFPKNICSFSDIGHGVYTNMPHSFDRRDCCICAILRLFNYSTSSRDIF